MLDSIVIDERFRGPPDSGNGGYVCGCLAAALADRGATAEVSLRRPPPLGSPLDIRVDEAGAQLLDGEAVVAEAAPIDAGSLGEPGPFVEPDAARAAVQGSAFLKDSHPFPTCFVCGPRREKGDGLRIFVGPVDDGFAAPWTPPSDLAREDGTVAPEMVWAALDCPTSAPGLNKPGPDGRVLPIVLARHAVEVSRPVRAGAEHVITSWEIARDGRKREAGAALWDAGGELLARARALWIELKAVPGAG